LGESRACRDLPIATFHSRHYEHSTEADCLTRNDAKPGSFEQRSQLTVEVRRHEAHHDGGDPTAKGRPLTVRKKLVEDRYATARPQYASGLADGRHRVWHDGECEVQDDAVYTLIRKRQARGVHRLRPHLQIAARLPKCLRSHGHAGDHRGGHVGGDGVYSVR
jgi:hypothetical protein